MAHSGAPGASRGQKKAGPLSSVSPDPVPTWPRVCLPYRSLAGPGQGTAPGELGTQSVQVTRRAGVTLGEVPYLEEEW